MQNETIIQIEDLKPLVGEFPTKTPEVITKELNTDRIRTKQYIPQEITAHVYCSSVEKDLVCVGKNSLFYGLIEAWNTHHPFRFGPDTIWLLILQGFSRHVNNNPERLRSLFVDFDGQKQLKSMHPEINFYCATKDDWKIMLSEFNQQIKDNIGSELMDIVTPNFTTTTELEATTCQLTVMSIFQKYFSYYTMAGGCGLPYVTVEGSLEDWEKLKEKTEKLGKYDLEWWTSKIIPILDEIINTKKGNINTSFWKRMVRVKTPDGQYVPDIYDGWFTTFFPFDFTNKRIDEIDQFTQLASELLDIPLDVALTTGESFKLNVRVGFIGLSQDPQTYELKPEMGWFVSDKPEDTKILSPRPDTFQIKKLYKKYGIT